MQFSSHLSSKKRCTVALDCDGVLLDFLTHFKTIGEYALGRELIDSSNVYDLSARYGLTSDERSRIMHIFEKENGWSNLPSLDGALDSAKELQEAGHRVIVVTAIEEQFRTARLSNLAHFGFVPDHMYCVGTQHGHTKSDAYKEEMPHVIVDDRLVYLQEAKNTIKRHTPELVWINDTVCQNGISSHFVHHEVDSLHKWATPVLLANHEPLSVQRKLNFS